MVSAPYVGRYVKTASDQSDPRYTYTGYARVDSMVSRFPGRPTAVRQWLRYIVRVRNQSANEISK